MIQVNFGSCKEYDVTNRFFSPQLAGGALLDIGTYALSLVRWFLHAQPDIVLTNMLPFETGVDEMSGIILRNSLDELATVCLLYTSGVGASAIIDHYHIPMNATIAFGDGDNDVELLAGVAHGVAMRKHDPKR